jgi:hypothetical protein
MTLDKDCAFTCVYNTINKSVMESYMTKKIVTYGLEREEMNYRSLLLKYITRRSYLK